MKNKEKNGEVKVNDKGEVKVNGKSKVCTGTIVVSPIQVKMAILENAYVNATKGEIKFGEVKSLFKKIHKELKKSAKSKE